MTKESDMKAAFRRTKIWKDFRKKMKEKQNGIDPITGTKLTKTANLHHRYFVTSENYTDLSNEDNFIFINKHIFFFRNSFIFIFFLSGALFSTTHTPHPFLKLKTEI